MLESLLLVVYAICTLNATDLSTDANTPCECQETTEAHADGGILELAIIDNQG